MHVQSVVEQNNAYRLIFCVRLLNTSPGKQLRALHGIWSASIKMICSRYDRDDI